MISLSGDGYKPMDATSAIQRTKQATVGTPAGVLRIYGGSEGRRLPHAIPVQGGPDARAPDDKAGGAVT